MAAAFSRPTTKSLVFCSPSRESEYTSPPVLDSLPAWRGEVPSLDYASENIRVNCLCPGSTRTAQTVARLKNAADPDAVIAPLVAHQAMKRLADPEEIAAAALFLASDESTFVTGTAFAVDAGWTAM